MPTPLPAGYVLREASIADIDAIVNHRLSMFRDMNVPLDEAPMRQAFASWLADMMPDGVYRGWLVETARGEIVAGVGVTILPWPPGPRNLIGRLPMVYNVYTESSHRRRGLAHALMETAHEWCRQSGFSVVGLSASDFGRPLYEALGYSVAARPYMFKGL